MFRFCTWAFCGRLNFGCACPFFLHSLFLLSASGKTWAPSCGGVSPHGLLGDFHTQQDGKTTLNFPEAAQIYNFTSARARTEESKGSWDLCWVGRTIRRTIGCWGMGAIATLISHQRLYIGLQTREASAWEAQTFKHLLFQVPSFSWFLMHPLIFWDGGGST